MSQSTNNDIKIGINGQEKEFPFFSTETINSMLPLSKMSEIAISSYSTLEQAAVLDISVFL